MVDYMFSVLPVSRISLCVFLKKKIVSTRFKNLQRSSGTRQTDDPRRPGVLQPTRRRRLFHTVRVALRKTIFGHEMEE